MLAFLPPIAMTLFAAWSQVDPQPASRACFESPAALSTFEFASNPWLNLYNFILKRAKESVGIDDDGLGARGYVAEDTAATRALTSDEALVWQNAVEFVARVALPDKMGVDSLVQNINDVLASAPPNENLAGTRLPATFRMMLQGAMPIYRSVWWPRHERRNQRWIASMRAALEGREVCLAERAARVFRTSWPSAPIHVDATVYANWFGAYSTHHPTRITVSANAVATQGVLGVEVLLHESAHGMLDTLDAALVREASRQKKPLPREFSHLVLFYTAGALMQELDSTYAPFADQFGIWRQSDLAQRYHRIIKQEWQPYLSGSRNFEDAVAALIGRLPS